MTRSADKWDGNMADSVEITGKGVAGKAKCIEERNELHVMAGIFVRRAVMLPSIKPMEREGEHNWLPLMQDELTAWLPQSHPMAELRAFPVAAFASEPYIETYPGRDIDNARVFARCGITPNLKFSTMDSLATYSMVEAGLGVSMNNAINGRAWSGKVRILPLDPPQTVEFGIASLPDLVPAAEKFLMFLKERMEEFRVDGMKPDLQK